MLSRTLPRVMRRCLSRSRLRRAVTAGGVAALYLAAAAPVYAAHEYVSPAQVCTIGNSDADGPFGDCWSTPSVGETGPNDPGFYIHRMLVRFDSPSLPPGAVIDGVSFYPGCEGPAERPDYTVYPLTTPWDSSVDWYTTDGTTPWTSRGAADDHGSAIDPADDGDVVSADYGVIVTRPGGYGAMLCSPSVDVEYHT